MYIKGKKQPHYSFGIFQFAFKHIYFCIIDKFFFFFFKGTDLSEITIEGSPNFDSERLTKIIQGEFSEVVHLRD